MVASAATSPLAEPRTTVSESFQQTRTTEVTRAVEEKNAAIYGRGGPPALRSRAAFAREGAKVFVAGRTLASAATETAGILDAVIEPDVQQIMITDAPAVLGLARFTELDERWAIDAIVGTLRDAEAQHQLHIEDPKILARLLLGP
jgi:hypothetical protein